MTKPFGKITANRDVIYSRYDPQEFVGRSWLIQEAARFRDNDDRRHLIIVGEPGSGKSTFIAYLAETWNCPCHFIRVDNIGGVTGIDPHSFLISLGFQLCQKYGRDIFDKGGASTTKVTVGLTKDKAEIVGRIIDELYTLPFDSPPQRDVVVKVGIATGESRVVGERVKKLVDVTHALDEATLLHVVVINPLQKIKELYPEEKVVILIDALDESLQHPGKRIVDIILRAADAAFPANLRLVMTSRRGDHLADFQADDILYLDDKEKGYWQAGLQDTQDYIKKRLKEPSLAKIIESWPEDEAEAYITEVRDNSDGNFLYLYHFFNELLDAIDRAETDLKKIGIPKGLDEVYRNFAVAKIRRNIKDSIQFTVSDPVLPGLIEQWQKIEGVEQVKVIDKDVTVIAEDSDKVILKLIKSALKAGIEIDDKDLKIQKGTGFGNWENKYLPLLGVLAVAFEPLSREQLAGFAVVEIVFVDTIIRQLQQFLDVLSNDQENRYRLYHNSFGEYLLDSSRNRDYPLDGPTYHYKVASYYRGANNRWSEVNWDDVQEVYPFQHLARHLAAARRNNELYALIDRSWMDAKFKRFYSHRAFSSDVELAIAVAEAETPTNLVQVVRGSIVYATLGILATNVPPEALWIIAQTGQVKTAQDYAALIQDKRLQSRAYCLIADTLLAHNGVEHKDTMEALEQALAAARSILQNEHRAQAFSEVSSAMARAGENQRAAELANEALGIAQAITEKEPRIRSLTEVAETLTRIGDKSQALAIVDEVLVGARDWVLGAYIGNVPVMGVNAELLVRAAFILVQVGENQRATEIAGEAHKATHAIWKKVNPVGAVRALGQVATIYKDVGETTLAARVLDEAFVLAEGMQGPESATALSELAHVLVRFGDRERAVDNAKKVLAAVQNITDKAEKASVLSQVAVTLKEAGEPTRAARVAAGAIDAAQDVGSARSKTVALCYLAQALADAGAKDRAAGIAGQAMALSHTLSDEQIRAWVWNHVGNTLTREGMIDAALAVPGAIQDDREKFWLLFEAGRVLAQRGEMERAVAIAEEVQQAAKHVQDALLRVEALSNVAVAMALAGQRERAVGIFDQALESAEEVQGTLNRVQVLAGVAGTLAKAGETTRAVKTAMDAQQVAEKIEDYRQQVQAFYEVAPALAQAGAFNHARAVAQRIQNLDYQMSLMALIAVARAMLQAGEFERVKTIINETDLRYPENWPELAEVQAEIALSLARLHQGESALESAKEIHPTRKVQTLNSVAVALAQVGEFGWAIRAAEEIDVQGWKAPTQSDVASYLAQAGEFERALSLTQDIQDERWKAIGLGRIADHFAKAGDSTRAVELADQALAIVRRIDDSPLKAAVLCKVAQMLHATSKANSVPTILSEAFATVRRFGRDQVFEVLRDSAIAMARLDDGQTLWAVYKAMMEIENWWASHS